LTLSAGRRHALKTAALAAHQAGRLDEADRVYADIIAREPTDFDALHLRGALRLQRGEAAEAIRFIERALHLRADLRANFNLALAYKACLRYADALAAVDRALALKADAPEAWNLRGELLMALCRQVEGIASYRRSLALRPDVVGVLTNLATALTEFGRGEEAVALMDGAIARMGASAPLARNRAAALMRLARYDEASEAYAQALELGDDASSLAHELSCRQFSCDWPGQAERYERLCARLAQGECISDPFALLAVCDDPQLQLSVARGNTHAPREALEPLWRGERYSHERIRVAYVSSDFYNHATTVLMAALLELHDRSRIEVLGVSWAPDDGSALRRRVVAACDRFVEIAQLSDLDAAALLRRLEVDVVVDLKGYSGFSRPRIFAARPAPVQVNYLGYPGTLGRRYMDYLVTDEVVVPLDLRGSYEEQLAYLPKSYQATDGRRARVSAVPRRADVGLPEDGVVFACFNNNYKITAEVYGAWMRILRATPGSVLWLLRDNPTIESRLRAVAAAAGVEPARIIFAPRIPHAEHLARHRLADLFLDTFPCNAHTTASDALWAGLPLLTLEGRSFAARVASSVLRCAGFAELVTTGLAEYEARACALAGAPAELAALRERVREQAPESALFATERYARELERGYLYMVERARAGLAPVAFRVREDLGVAPLG
jgi:protein O-GlcNAc transferase